MQASTSLSPTLPGPAPIAAPPATREPWRGGTAGLKRAHYREARLPLLLLLPQLLVLLLFFFIPAIRALSQAFVITDPFGNSVQFVWFDNFRALLASPEYRVVGLGHGLVHPGAERPHLWSSRWCSPSPPTAWCAAAASIAASILLPYAIAPVIAGILWAFLFNPSVGPVAFVLKALGIAWDPIRSGFDAFLLVTFAASWKHICYDYIFLVAALLAVPPSLLEAAAVDGAGPLLRFFRIALPMIGPTIFFLLAMNFVYGFFETFAIIDAVTQGGPGGATMILVYKVYLDGFVHINLGSSAAQSVLMMIFALVAHPACSSATSSGT